MQILQFTCLNPQVCAALKTTMLDQVNTWSRLSRLAADPDQTTAPFPASTWHSHTRLPVHWVIWANIYDHLGDDGRKIADVMIGSSSAPGPLLRTDLGGGAMLELVEVNDLIAAGYMLSDPEPAGDANETTA